MPVFFPERVTHFCVIRPNVGVAKMWIKNVTDRVYGTGREGGVQKTTQEQMNKREPAAKMRRVPVSSKCFHRDQEFKRRVLVSPPLPALSFLPSSTW